MGTQTAEDDELAAGAVRVQERGDGVCSLYERGLTWVDVSPVADVTCKISFSLRRLRGLGLISGRLHGVHHHHGAQDNRARERWGASSDDFSLHLNLAGTSVFASRGREIVLREGDAMLLSYAESRDIVRPGAVRYQIIRVPRAALSLVMHNVETALLRPIPCGTGALRLLAHYVDAVMDDPALATPDLRRVVTSHLCDLVTATIGALRDSEAEESRGVRAARLRAVKDDVLDHLTDLDLVPAVLARRQQVSESYIRKLFQEEGTSFTELVREHRLKRARQMLIDARFEARSIASMALDSGFRDLSYFNRSFRRAFGETPSEARERARLKRASEAMSGG